MYFKFFICLIIIIFKDLTEVNATDLAERCWSQFGAVDLNGSASQIEIIQQELELIIDEQEVNGLILCLHKRKYALL